MLSTEELTLPNLRLEPAPKLNPAAREAIMQADLVVIAPGNLYVSLAPALLVPGVADALAATHAQKIYICNLVTKPGQTSNFTVADFASEIERFLEHKVRLDYVLYNNAKPSDELLKKYAQDGEFWVEYDKKQLKAAHYKPIGGSFVLNQPWHTTAKKDLLARTLIRHDAHAVAKALLFL